LAASRPNRAAEVEPVPAGHEPVGDDEREVLVLQQREGPLTIYRDGDIMACRGQHSMEQQARRPVVFGDQDVHGSPGRNGAGIVAFIGRLLSWASASACAAQATGSRRTMPLFSAAMGGYFAPIRGSTRGCGAMLAATALGW